MTPDPTVRRQSKITIAELNALREPGRHSVGDGLLLVVGASGSRSWLARIRDANSRRRDIGLGQYPEISLKEARERGAALRKQVRDGLDPVVEKRKAREVTPTFKDAAEKAHGERTAGFRNRKHAAQWITTLRDYAYPHFGNLPVNKVTGPMIVQAMKPIWSEKPETARRTLQRIGTVIAWSAAHGYCDNEAPMKSILMGLPPQTKTKKNHAAIPYVDAPAFMTALCGAEDTLGRQVLQLVILTAGRSNEIRGATWSEVDLDRAIWTVPADRIKMGKEHRVPLSAPAHALLSRLHAFRTEADLIFPSYTGRAISDVAVSKVMREMGSTATVHGWRSTFRDWGAEETSVDKDTIEKALAHQVVNAVERAYRRGDLLEKRRALMEDWAKFLFGEPEALP
ncbi:tyrosine-type recombinase/integrase [Sphingomonas prati]|uniref:Integrase n=1 Tax=Sphingomonas prati TaxID=1843237 RepID=A0A7W9BQM2_9SPHN|nr:site-specific integrase [Sphingomonas prati]MBB5728324.1 integrase [Sphingomonas prati]GGE74688.1 bacteriophage P4 integrase [Sphingomonas prati]